MTQEMQKNNKEDAHTAGGRTKFGFSRHSPCFGMDVYHTGPGVIPRNIQNECYVQITSIVHTCPTNFCKICTDFFATSTVLKSSLMPFFPWTTTRPSQASSVMSLRNAKGETVTHEHHPSIDWLIDWWNLFGGGLIDWLTILLSRPGQLRYHSRYTLTCSCSFLTWDHWMNVPWTELQMLTIKQTSFLLATLFWATLSYSPKSNNQSKRPMHFLPTVSLNWKLTSASNIMILSVGKTDTFQEMFRKVWRKVQFSNAHRPPRRTPTTRPNWSHGPT